MSFAEQCAWLVREPFRLSLETIGRLDDYQIGAVYGYPTDEKGRPLPSFPAPQMNHYEQAVELWFLRGLSRARARRRYGEWLDEMAALEKAQEACG